MLRLVCYYLLLLALLSSGCVWGAARFGRRFEHCLPLFLTGLVCVLFLFGLFGLLRLGVYALLLLALLLYAAALPLLRREGKAARERILTPAALLFALTLAALFYLNYGHEPYRIDEMTHWADTVKAMYCTGLLPCAPGAASSFPAYPPGMALLEYCFVTLFDLVSGRRVWAEWVMYVAYQCFLLSFFFPFFDRLSYRRPLHALLTLGLVLLSPLMMDASHPFSALYIDPFLSVVFGCGLAQVFSLRDKDGWYEAYIAACCVMLVLAKPAGLVLAVFLAAAYLAERLLQRPAPAVRRRSALIAAASVLLPFGLWSLTKALFRVGASYSGKEGAIDPALILRLVLRREGESWQQITHDDYYLRLFTDSLRIKGFACPYWLLLLVSALAIYLLLRLRSRSEPELLGARKLLLPALLVMALIYYVSLCYIYIFKFGWWEAVTLAEFPRYAGIFLYAVYTAALLCFVRFLAQTPQKSALLLVALGLFVLLSPFGRALELAKRTEPRASLSYYRNYRSLAARLDEETGGGSARVYLVMQGEPGGEFPAFRYCLRPHSTIDSGEWFFGPSPIPGEKDRERLVSAEDWERELRADYDYVYLYLVDDYFREHYAPLFAPGSDIAPRCLYRVTDEGLLLLGRIEG